MVIHIYAEHLVNIRTLSIQASLPSPSEETTKATISSDGQTIVLTHAGEDASLALPARVPARLANTELKISQAASRDISFRIPLRAQQNQNGTAEPAKPVLVDDADLSPWSARTLTPDVQISCSACRTTIIERGRIKQWKDLPSENWAEMMDFWHCHRPHVPHDAQGALKKGYAADSKLALLPGVGMVDHGHFVLHPDDCVGVEPTTNNNSEVTLHCSTCKTPLGTIDPSSDGHKLLKSHLALSPSAPSAEPQSYSAELWLTAHLLAAVSTQGVRKFRVTASTFSSPQHALNLWIFTPDLTISSTSSSSGRPIRVAKILWREAESSSGSAEGDMEIDEGRLDRKALSQGYLEIPGEELGKLRECLERSAVVLPGAAREFLGWRVGVLERFGRI